MAGATVIDLSDVRVVDNHCHSVERAQDQSTPEQLRAFLTESPDPWMRTEAVQHSVFYQRMVTDTAGFHAVPPDEVSVLRARAGHSEGGLTHALLGAAGLAALVVDTGFPDPAGALSVSELAAAAGCPAVGLLRLEIAFQQLVVDHAAYDDLMSATRALLGRARATGWAGFKSIVGYRTGLGIRRWSSDQARESFASARAELARAGAVRLGHKPLLDTLLHVAMAAAADQGLPVQFHVGYGDPDADLREAHPLLLREVLEEPAYREAAVVLLHGCWPFVREGAYLAAVYGNAYLDLSYGIPFLSRQEMRSMTRAALGAAPSSKLMYSSDGSRVPELHWMGARDGRRIIGEVLGEIVADGDLTPAQARAAGEQVLRDNALALYAIGDQR